MSLSVFVINYGAYDAGGCDLVAKNWSKHVWIADPVHHQCDGKQHDKDY